MEAGDPLADWLFGSWADTVEAGRVMPTRAPADPDTAMMRHA